MAWTRRPPLGRPWSERRGLPLPLPLAGFVLARPCAEDTRCRTGVLDDRLGVLYAAVVKGTLDDGPRKEGKHEAPGGHVLDRVPVRPGATAGPGVRHQAAKGR